MGVTVDLYAGASAHTSLANGSTFSFTNQTVNSGLQNAVLFVIVCDDGAAGTSFQVNWDTAGTNQLMTQLGSNAIAGVGNVFFYGLINPTAGNKTLGVKRTSGSTADVDVFSVSLYNASQNFNLYTVAAGNGTAATSAPFTVSGGVGDYVFSAINTATTSPSGPTGGTARFGPDVLSSGVDMGADSFATSTNTTHTYSLSVANSYLGLIIDIPGFSSWGFDSNTTIGDSVAVLKPIVRNRYSATKGKSEFAIFSNNFQYLDFSLQHQQPPQPHWAGRPNRTAAIMAGEQGIEASLNSSQFNIGGFIQAWQPPHLTPEKRAAAIMPRDDGIEQIEFRWFNYGWDIQPPQPPHPHPEQRAAAIMIGDGGIELQYTNWKNTGWEIAPHQPQHPRSERSGAVARGDDGSENVYTANLVTTAWGFEIQSVQPQHIPRPSAAIAQGDVGNEFTLINWFNAGWEIQAFQPPHQFRERRGAIAPKEDGIEAAFIPPQPVVNSGFDPVLALFSRNPKTAQRYPATKGRSEFGIFFQFYPSGFEFQNFQPPHPTPEKRAGGVMPILPGIDNIYTFIPIGSINWGSHPELPTPLRFFTTINQRGFGASGESHFMAFNLLPFVDDEVPIWQKPKRIDSSLTGEQGIEAKLIPFLGYWGFEIQAVQPPWPGAVRTSGYVPASGAIAKGDDGIYAPLINFYPPGWEIPSFQIPFNFKPARFAAMAPITNAPDAAFINTFLVNWGYETPSFQIPFNRVPSFFGAIAPSSNIEFPFFNWYNNGYEIQSIQPPHPKPERAGSIMPIEPGIELPFIFNPLNPLVNWAFEAPPPQPPQPRQLTKGGIMPKEDGIELPFVFVPIPIVSWGFDPPIPYKRVPFNRAGAIARGDEGIEASKVNWFNAGWEIQPPPPPHQFRERRGFFLRGDEGIQAAKINWFNAGWEIQPPPPPHQFRERRGFFLRGDEGSEFTEVRWFNYGWEIQPLQPPHPRREKAGSIMPIEPGIEAVYIFVSPPVLAAFVQDQATDLRSPALNLARGAILLFDGLGMPFFPPPIPPPPGPPLATAAKVIGLDADFGSADVTRVFLSRTPSNVVVGDSVAIIIAVGTNLNLNAQYRMVFTKPDGTIFHVDSPNTYVGRVDAATRQGTFEAQTYTICVLSGPTVNQQGIWSCFLQAPNFTSTSQQFYIGPPAMLQ